MRESFGGAFIINLLLIFVVVFVSFMALAISYSKAFRIKNQVINIIEQNQYSDGDSETKVKIDEYLTSVAYSVKDVTCEGNLTNNGACIVSLGDDTTGPYYKVTTYIKVDFPFFGINLVVPISGETKIIHVS